MALPIIERPLYGQIILETFGPGSGSWVDRTASLNNVSYSEGGRLTMPGANSVDVGTLTASFKDLSTTPLVGDFIRLRRAGTSEYAFTGFVRDVGQKVIFDNSVSLTTPLTITTLYCVDWVAYTTQWIVNGVGGRNTSFGLINAGGYEEGARIRALNYSLDNTNATQLISATSESGASSQQLCDTDYTGTIADHLDLVSRSTGMIWYGSHVIPTDNTTGRDNLIKWQGYTGNLSSGKTFSDVAGSAGTLHYTEIDFESSSQNVANVITIRNKTLIRFPDRDLSKIGGANESNFIYVDLSTKQIGIAPDTEWRYDDTASQDTYGARFTDVETNIHTPIARDFLGGVDYYIVNQIANPSVEYTDLGWSATSANRVRRRQPSADATPFDAYDGTWAIRVRQTSQNTTSTVNYSGGESDGIPVTAGRYYSFGFQARGGSPSRVDLKALARINWYDDSDALISSSSGTNTNFVVGQWNDVQHFALAPAGASRATISIVFGRVGSGNIFFNDVMWIDALVMKRTNSANSFGLSYLDGDTAKGTAGLHVWSGEVGNSQSMALENQLYNRAVSLASEYSTTSVRATRIRWNAQEDLASVSALTIGRRISIVYKGTTNNYRIIGIDGELSGDRYMIDYYLVKV
jgi:hypothetical protein